MILLNGVEYSENDVFNKVIVTELAPTKPVLCKFARELVRDIPKYFWDVSASASGKYHPEYANGHGGLARHTLMVYRWMKDLIEVQPNASLEVMKEFIPSMVVATLFHDSFKRGDGNGDITNTVHEHPLIATKFIFDKSNEFVKNNKDFIDSTADDEESFKQDVAIVLSCIQSHMGKWSTSKHSNVTLPVPKDAYQQMVHLADYAASRKYTTFDVEYFSNLMSK